MDIIDDPEPDKLWPWHPAIAFPYSVVKEAVKECDSYCISGNPNDMVRE